MRPWRLLILLYTLPGFIAIFILSKMPESPQFFISRGRNIEAMNAIQWICETNHGPNSKHLSGKKLKSDVKVQSEILHTKKFG